MRVLATTVGALTAVVMAGQTQAMDWDTFTVYGHPIPPPATVSFSIGYPKGWIVQDYSQERRDIYNGTVVSPDAVLSPPLFAGPTCIFAQPGITNTLRQQSFTTYVIWPSGVGTAEENAEAFFNGKGSTETGYWHKSIKPVKTSAGDFGWVVESEGYVTSNPVVRKLVHDPAFMRTTNAWNEIVELNKTVKPDRKVSVTYHDFFFGSGNQGAIRIEIMTHTANASGLAELDRMVLETLRF